MVLDKTKNSLLNQYAAVVLPLILLAMDYGVLVFAERMAYALRNICVPLGGVLKISWLNSYIVFPGCMILFMHVMGLYTSRMQFWMILAKLFKAILYGTLTIVLSLYFGSSAVSTSRLFVALFTIFSFGGIALERLLVKKILHGLNIFQIPVLLMGAGKTAELLLPSLQHDSGLGYEFIGFLDDGAPSERISAIIPYLGKFSDAEKVIQDTGVKKVMVIAPGMEQPKIQNLIYRLQPLVKSIGFVPDLGSIPLGTLDIVPLVDGHAAMFKVRNNLALWYNRWLKYSFDWCLTLLGTILISPILVGIAVWVYKDSPGAVIFKHRRVGKDGKEFSCYKFRSMCVDAQEKLETLLQNDPQAKAEWEQDFKLKNDPRITKSGEFLRKTSLDELPQIFNVLKGEMSLVGPRPIIQEEVARYGDYKDDYFMVRPGITGMWQTSGRSDINYDERVQMDTWYVRNWNIWFDIVLLWRTFSVVINKKGAY